MNVESDTMPGILKSDDNPLSPITSGSPELPQQSVDKNDSEQICASQDKTECGGSCDSAQNCEQSVDMILESMLDYLAKSQDAPFKSQQVGDPDLDFLQKKDIAKELLKQNPARFLDKFGEYLLEDHLNYFTCDSSSQCYEVDFHIKRLKRFHCKAKNQVDVRNRRYEALKKLVEGGIYFSEEEMKKRNPLMYEQLIGQYMTPEEREEQRKKERRKHDRSYVNHLMGQIEEHYVNCLKKQQMDDEEMDTSDEEELAGGRSESIQKENDDIEEFDTESETEDVENKKVPLLSSTLNTKTVTWEDKYLFREEFTMNMYESFLNGDDTDFDYSTVDSNPEYESVAIKGQDEEDKYFDSETPELIQSGNASGADDDVDEEEDELDKFMKNLQDSEIK